MPGSRPPHPPEFRRQPVELVWAGRTPGELPREFEPTAQSTCAPSMRMLEFNRRMRARAPSRSFRPGGPPEVSSAAVLGCVIPIDMATNPAVAWLVGLLGTPGARQGAIWDGRL